MNVNIPQAVLELMDQVAKLQKDLEEERKARVHLEGKFLYRLRKHRAEIIRLQCGESGEKWHSGPVYTRGSRLRIPGRPQLLRWRIKHCRGRRDRILRNDPSSQQFDRIINEESGRDGERRNGVPTLV